MKHNSDDSINQSLVDVTDNTNKEAVNLDFLTNMFNAYGIPECAQEAMLKDISLYVEVQVMKGLDKQMEMLIKTIEGISIEI